MPGKRARPVRPGGRRKRTRTAGTSPTAYRNMQNAAAGERHATGLPGAAAGGFMRAGGRHPA